MSEPDSKAGGRAGKGKSAGKSKNVTDQAATHADSRSDAGIGATVDGIRVGIGGWVYAPWRNNFYPEGLPQTKELEYASRQVSAIEINGTFYGSQKPQTFARWREQTPEHFIFSMKAPRYATNRRELASAGDSIQRFVHSGIAELGPKLGPIVWQFPPTKHFDAVDFEAFLEQLPAQIESLPLRHVLEVRHDSFATPEFLALARRHGAATVFTDSEAYPSFADVTGDFVYARLMRSQKALKTGYAEKDLDAWGQRARQWAAGESPPDLPRIDSAGGRKKRREVFVYFIDGAKEHAPAAACALLQRLCGTPGKGT